MHADANIFLHYHLNLLISSAKRSTMYFTSKEPKHIRVTSCYVKLWKLIALDGKKNVKAKQKCQLLYFKKTYKLLVCFIWQNNTVQNKYLPCYFSNQQSLQLPIWTCVVRFKARPCDFDFLILTFFFVSLVYGISLWKQMTPDLSA